MKRLFANSVLATIALAAIGFFLLNLPQQSSGKQSEAGHGHEEGGHADGVEMSDDKLRSSDIELLVAAPGVLHDSLLLNGILQPNQEALVQVTPRFPGVVREIKASVGHRVEKNDLLAKIESNQSLTTYEIRAPLAGTVIDRQISLGEYASEQKAAFTIADISTVWVDLSVYRRDLKRVREGDKVVIDVGDGGKPIDARLTYISPVGSADTQSALARTSVPNEGTRLRPGMFVTARLMLSDKSAPIVVKSTAVQSFENRNVVFVRNGLKFEVREVELGARDREHVEVQFGLEEGDLYVGRNSFIVKAEIAKGTAAHEH
ncbi:MULTISPECIES: divalent metal ion exporter adaptor subunit IhpB [Bradyrhizobium]|uniref:Efflux RND transporter periplasmic adaptor subunit n=1 Tax=Bradyrhizobium betae TaxID=244734 RepID=A0A5P6PGW3_9BRAD|nr:MULTISPECIES: efflux RND transporter periplasmic adaptor subunit [Bradyrhizobium]MBJ7402713.1 efflux RND transporter periplasmic adaptor subunit [Bradyrhizobium sp.]QFI77408.1 efflux RND transporter periplasmic adaptor subunit [Bradyrhizobium betae]